MAINTPNMNLTVWNSLTDAYKHDELASNFVSLDRHDHSPGNGVQINGATAIKDHSIPSSKFSSDFSLSSNNYVDNTIPGTAIQSASSGIGISATQMENNSIGSSQIINNNVGKEELKVIPHIYINRNNTVTRNGSANAASLQQGWTNAGNLEYETNTGEASMSNDSDDKFYPKRNGIFVFNFMQDVDMVSEATYNNANTSFYNYILFEDKTGADAGNNTVIAMSYARESYSGNRWVCSCSSAIKVEVGDAISFWYRIRHSSTASSGNLDAISQMRVTWIGNSSSY